MSLPIFYGLPLMTSGIFLARLSSTQVLFRVLVDIHDDAGAARRQEASELRREWVVGGRRRRHHPRPRRTLAAAFENPGAVAFPGAVSGRSRIAPALELLLLAFYGFLRALILLFLHLNFLRQHPLRAATSFL